jgi:hypothetical protein
MIVRDNDLYTEVTPIEPIRRQVSENWHYAWQLVPVRSAPEQLTAKPAEKLATAVPTLPPPNCGGNSDNQIIRPITLLYQAVNQRNIDLYAHTTPYFSLIPVRVKGLWPGYLKCRLCIL